MKNLNFDVAISILAFVVMVNDGKDIPIKEAQALLDYIKEQTGKEINTEELLAYIKEMKGLIITTLDPRAMSQDDLCLHPSVTFKYGKKDGNEHSSEKHRFMGKK